MLKPRLTVILGPTASGKTDYAIKIAKNMEGDPSIRGAEVVSADSRQVYAGMNIGTAKPEEAWDSTCHPVSTSDVVMGIPHYFFNIREPNKLMSLSEWQAAAFEVIDGIIARGKLPILVGGTMLYIDSVVLNFEIPAVTPDLRFREEKGKLDVEILYQELLQKDSEAQQFIEPRNTRRIIRALEVIEVTGKPFSESRKRHEPRYHVEMIGLFPIEGWDELKRRIEKRAQVMFREGLLEEVEKLQKEYGKDLPLLKTQNYRQAAQVLDGTLSNADAVKDMVKSDMRYAHRQMSWWKGREEIRWV